MPSLVEEWYRFKHESRTRAYVENFNNPLITLKALKTSLTGDTLNLWESVGSKYFSKDDTEGNPAPSIKASERTDIYDRIVKYYQTDKIDSGKMDFDIKVAPFNSSLHWGSYVIVNGILPSDLGSGITGTGAFWDSDSLSIDFESYPSNTWYHCTITWTRSGDSLLFQYIVTDPSGTITDSGTSTVTTARNNIIAFQFQGSAGTSTAYNYARWIDNVIVSYWENDIEKIYIAHSSGYCLRLRNNGTYSLSITLSEGDEFRFDQYMDSIGYTKFSTDGFYITQDGDTIKIKGTDTSERSYPLTDGVWYNIRAIFYSLYGKSAMKVRVYDSSGTLVYEFTPVYSTVKNPFENPLFSTQSGYSGLIDNLEVWR